MPQSLSNVLVHTIFSTKDRRPFFQDIALRTELHRYLTAILTNLNCPPIIVGGAEDHVHLFNGLSRTLTQADMVKEIKRSSSIWLKNKNSTLHDFAWQAGYGIFSVSFSQTETVQAYIAGQDEHHRKVSFQDELRHMLRLNKITFDERYIWD
jgi:REP element-mobilizing transposase RayT